MSYSLSASLEDYLEAIYLIRQQKDEVRAKDIADRLSVSGASVTGALHALVERDLVNHEPYEGVTLTEQGRSIAQGVCQRHQALYQFFVRVLGLNKDDAEECACKMEHAVPDHVLERFMAFLSFMERCPEGGARWCDQEGFMCSQIHGLQGKEINKL